MSRQVSMLNLAAARGGCSNEGQQRERDLVSQLNAQAEACQVAAQAHWEAVSEEKARAAIEPYKAMLARAEMERMVAEHAAAESARQVENLAGFVFVCRSSPQR